MLKFSWINRKIKSNSVFNKIIIFLSYKLNLEVKADLEIVQSRQAGPELLGHLSDVSRMRLLSSWSK